MLVAHSHCVSVDKAGFALDQSDERIVEQHGHALAQLGHDLFLAVVGCLVVDGESSGGDAILVGLLEQVDDLGVAAQGLGGDATAVEARASQVGSLDDGNLELATGGRCGGLIAAGASPYDEEIVGVAHCSVSSL